MLTDEELIDACVAGTEHAHLIDRAAKAQRAGVLATLSEVGASLKLLPTLEQCDGCRFTFREWAQRRRRCIFITSTQSTREALRRTHAAWFNILFGKLMGTSFTTSGQRPCWVMIDEAHSPGIEHNSVVSKEQIMALPNLHFYWKYGDAVVPFRIEAIKRPKRAPAFVLRQPRPVAEPPQPLPADAPAKENDHEQVDELEIAPQDVDSLDTRF
jgi:type IV secretion system coupling TraD/TrwB family protein